MSAQKFWVSNHYIAPIIYGDYSCFDYSSFEGEQDKFDAWMSENASDRIVEVISDEDSPELKRCDIVGVLSNCVQISVTNITDSVDEEDYEEALAEARYFSRMEDREFEMSCCVKECEWESRL